MVSVSLLLLLDSKEWNTFFPRQEFFSFQLQTISNKQLFYCIYRTSPVSWVLAPLASHYGKLP